MEGRRSGVHGYPWLRSEFRLAWAIGNPDSTNQRNNAVSQYMPFAALAGPARVPAPPLHANLPSSARQPPVPIISSLYKCRRVSSPVMEIWHPFPVSSLVLLSVPRPDSLPPSKTQTQSPHGM